MTSDDKRILIVDDEPDIANLYKLSLECDGFVVDTFNDPLLVLSNYRAGIYDLLLINIKMPQMNDKYTKTFAKDNSRNTWR